MESAQNKQQDASKYPFDLDALKKGDYITPEKLVEVIGAGTETRTYKFRMLAIVDQMRQYLFHKGLVWTIKIERDGIRICTDEQASEYNPTQYDFARKRMKRLYAQNAAVDINNLTDETKAAHLRRLQIHGMEITALNKSRIEALRSLHEIENNK